MSRRRFFASLCTLVFILNLARIVYAPLLDVLIAEFSIGEATAGLIVTLTWIGSAAPRLPTGWVLTKVPRYPVVVGSGIVLILSGAIAATATSVLQLMGGAFLMGLGSGVYFVAAQPLLSELFPDRIGQVVGIHGVSNQLASVAAAPFVTLTLLIDWRLSMWGISGLGALAASYTWYSGRQTNLPRAGTEDRELITGVLSEWPLVVTALAITGLSMFVWQGVFNFYELYMQSKAFSGQEAGTLLTLVFVAGIPAFYVGGDLAERLPYIPYITSVVGSFGVCVCLLTIVDSLLMIGLVTIGIGFFGHAQYPAVDTFLLDTLPDHSRASAYSVFSSTAILIQALGSVVLGQLIEWGYSYDQIFLIAAFLIILAASCFSLADRTGHLLRSHQ